MKNDDFSSENVSNLQWQNIEIVENVKKYDKRSFWKVKTQHPNDKWVWLAGSHLEFGFNFCFYFLH